MDLRGKKVVVTGGVSGLGLAIVEKLLACESVVTVFDINAVGLEALRTRFNGVNCVTCDISNFEQVSEAAKKYGEELGAANVLINNAGILHSESLIKIRDSGVVKHDVANWNKVLAADLSSVFYMTVCFVEKMITTRTKGVIVNISSVSAGGNPGQSAYAAAKAGVNALTAVWAKELGPMGIRVVAIAPGFTETESTRAAMSETALQETIKRVPLRRLGKPEEIADGVLFAIQNDFYNGKVLALDGGLII
jgi:3-oxoacyl-[acyl-carrier protein] reductase